MGNLFEGQLKSLNVVPAKVKIIGLVSIKDVFEEIMKTELSDQDHHENTTLVPLLNELCFTGSCLPIFLFIICVFLISGWRRGLQLL
jgi:CBS domain containing-hemolysin-like protein